MAHGDDGDLESLFVSDSDDGLWMQVEEISIEDANGLNDVERTPFVVDTNVQRLPAIHTTPSLFGEPLSRSSSTTSYHSTLSDSRFPPFADTTSSVQGGDPERTLVEENEPASFDLDSILGSDKLSLPVKIIANDTGAQKKMDRHGIAFGVQYMIALGVAQGWWSWDDITDERLDNLIGNHATAIPKVVSIMLEAKDPNATAFKVARSADAFRDNVALGKEYDREQMALCEASGRGLGCTEGGYEGVRNWYGGRIQQVVRVETLGLDKKEWKLVLQEPEMKRSYHLARKMGSRRLLELRIPKDARDSVRPESLACKFVLLGRIYVPFAAKENKIYMVETSENHGRNSDASQGDNLRWSFQEFVNYCNPMSLNMDQTISKWSTRFEILLSTSLPAVEFKPENITLIHDIYAQHNTTEGKPPAEICLTDGCGFASLAAHLRVAQAGNLLTTPTAIQARIYGSKGVYNLDHNDRLSTDPPRAYIRRNSQIKVKHAGVDVVDRAHRILDLVSISRVTYPGRLSKQLILNLSHNGVPDSAFQKLLVKGFEDEIEPLLRWSGPNASRLLWGAVSKAGNVPGARLQRLAGGMGRTFGLPRRFDSDDLDGDIDMGELDAEFTVVQPEKSASLHETVLRLIEAGFTPENCSYLREKHHLVVRVAVDSLVEDFRFVVPGSAMAILVPDPLGVLEDHQVHFKMDSRVLKDPVTGMDVDSVPGSALLCRHPTYVASDTQKVTVVNHAKLADYVGVIVCSIRGDRSLASYLSGGDYDGDQGLLIWEPDLVEPFRTKDIVLPPPNFLKNNFDCSVTNVPAFCRRLSTLPPDERHMEFVQTLLGGLRDNLTGPYSICHANAVYSRGYGDPETERLAFMCTNCLDSNKSGYRPREDVRSQDFGRYRRGWPPFMKAKKGKAGESRSTANTPRLKRTSNEPLVLERIHKGGEALASIHFQRLGALEAGASSALDQALFKPYTDARDAASLAEQTLNISLWKEDLEALKDHVRTMHRRYSTLGNPASPAWEPAKHALVYAFTHQRPPPRGGNPALVHLILADRAAICASYAYFLTTANYGEAQNVKFPFTAAFEDLCRIKANACGSKAVVDEMKDVMVLQGSVLRLLAGMNQVAVGGA